jgi:hypothetical protein
MGQPQDRSSLQQYDVDDQVLARWREARKECLSARARLLRQINGRGSERPAAPAQAADS